MKVNTHLSAPPLAPIKADPYAYLFSTVTIDFITDLPESNRYNTLYSSRPWLNKSNSSYPIYKNN